MTAARLLRNLPRKTGNLVVVTSPLPRDGKTRTSVGLAAAAVALGRTAILLDLDLRRPGLARIVGVSPGDKDLIDYLEGRATLDEVVVTNPAASALKAIPARAREEDLSPLLNSAALSDLIDTLRGQFDLVVLDTPPVLCVADAQIFQARADAVLMVLCWGRTTPDLILSAVDQFEVPLTGVIFNWVDFRRHARMGYGDQLQHSAKFSSYYKLEGSTPGPMLNWRADTVDV